MEGQSLYQTIFKRKSVRKFSMEAIESEKLDKIAQKLSYLKPLNSEIKTEFKLISQSDVNGLFSIKAPHYIVAFSEVKDGYLTNVGFMLQQVDLYLSSIGIGCCYQGMGKPKKEGFKDSQLEVVIILAIGNPKEKVYRDSINEFKRKNLNDITNINGLGDFLEPVRLAPSAVNSQPWYFTGSETIIHAYCEKPKFLKKLIYEKMNKIDMGIALYHLFLAAENVKKETIFIYDVEAAENPPSSYYYVESLEFN